MLQMGNNSFSRKQMTKTKPENRSFNKNSNFGKSNRVGSKSGTILNEAKYQRVHKDRPKHLVVFHKRNQGNCTNTSIARCWYSTKESKTQCTWPTTWWCAIDNGQTILALQSKWWLHHPQRCNPIPEILWRNWWRQKLPNCHNKAASYRSTPASPRRIWKTSWNYLKNNCVQKKSFITEIRLN